MANNYAVGAQAGNLADLRAALMHPRVVAAARANHVDLTNAASLDGIIERAQGLLDQKKSNATSEQTELLKAIAFQLGHANKTSTSAAFAMGFHLAIPGQYVETALRAYADIQCIV